jgi:hypothetical protein
LTPENKIIDLLEWATRHGFIPDRPARNDLYLEVASRRIVRHRDLQPHQRRSSYWIPNIRGLKRLGLPVRKSRISDMIVVEALNFTGAGLGEHEAALSMVNHMRGQFRTRLAA